MIKLLKTALVVLVFSLVLSGAIYASSYITHNDGPVWTPPVGYVSGVCSDTAYGETVCLQYTTDGTALNYPNNNPSVWNGVKTACGWSNNGAPCTDSNAYWRCTIPQTADATINYRFYVVNQTAGSNCAYDGDVYYSVGTDSATLLTGPTALNVASLSGKNSLALALFIGLGAVTGGFIIWRRRA